MSKIPAYVAFEGGGAKGVAHVGALRAIEEVPVEVHGYAGTSAGAIVAALAAAQFTSKQLYDPATGATIFETLGDEFRTLTNFLGKGPWERLRRVRDALGPSVMWKLPVGLLVYLIVFTESLTVSWGRPIAMACLWAAAGVVGYLGFRLARGIVSLETFYQQLSILLNAKADRAGVKRHKDGVTFEDMRALGWTPLKIVASNLNERKIQVFSLEETPTARIADAVAASIAIPFVFSPWVIGKTTYVDGGMLSNLPAWVFEEERSLEPESAVVAIGIDTSDPRRAQLPLGTFRWLPALLGTALFGTASLSKRVQGEMVEVKLRVNRPDRSPLKVLDFDAPLDVFKAVMQDAYDVTKLKVERQLWDIPQDFRESLKVLRREVRRRCAADLTSADGSVFKSHKDSRFRVAVALRPRNHLLSWRLAYERGFRSTDPDWHLLLPSVGSIVGKAVSEGKPICMTLGELQAYAQQAGHFAHSMAANGWTDLTWSVAAPINYPDHGTVAALVIDSNLPLNGTAADVLAVLTDIIESGNEMLASIDVTELLNG